MRSFLQGIGPMPVHAQLEKNVFFSSLILATIFCYLFKPDLIIPVEIPPAPSITQIFVHCSLTVAGCLSVQRPRGRPPGWFDVEIVNRNEEGAGKVDIAALINFKMLQRGPEHSSDVAS